MFNEKRLRSGVGRVASWLGVGLWLGWVTSAGAYDLFDPRFEWWTGTGPNAAAVVVDFWPDDGAGGSFAFGCRFAAESVTGREVLDALQAAQQGFAYAASAAGFVTDIWYTRGATVWHATYAWPESYISYWWSMDCGEVWDYALTGMDERTLQDGDTDGWLALPGDDWWSVPVTPLVPPAVAGDLDGNGVVNALDIRAFVLALTAPREYLYEFPGCNIDGADVNADGGIDALDINPFVQMLVRR